MQPYELKLNNNYENIVANILDEGEELFLGKKHSIKSMVMGISGGVDSAIVANLARKICDRVGMELHGIYMPIETNKPDEEERAVAVATESCHHFGINTSLGNRLQAMLEAVDPEIAFYRHANPLKAKLTHEQRVRVGNVKARMRMIYLYNYASAHNGLVLSTDNLTEYYMGFWTLMGDEGDTGLIQQLWKTEVFGIADILSPATKLCADAKPTDGLGVSNSDLEQLLPGFTGTDYRAGYRQVDDIIIKYLQTADPDVADHPVIERMLKTGYKRRRPENLKRSDLLYNYS